MFSFEWHTNLIHTNLILNLFLIILLISVKFYWQCFKLSNIRGPFCFPLVGNIQKVLFNDPSDFVKILKEMFDSYGEFYKVWLGPDLFFVVSKPEYLEIILNSPDCLQKGDLYRFFKPILKDGIFTGAGEKWKSHRKMIAPTFNVKLINSYIPIMNQYVKVMLAKLENNRLEPDILKITTNYSLDTVSRTMLRTEMNQQVNDGKIGALLGRFAELAVLRVTKFWLSFDLIFRFSRYNKEWREKAQQFDALSQKVMEERKYYMDKENENCQENEGKHFINALINRQMKNEITQSELDDEIKTLIATGVETNATTTCFALTLLGIRQEIQNKLYEEIIDVLDDREVTLEDLPNLKYTEYVIKETLRLVPPSVGFTRKATNDVLIDEFVIPKGAQIFVGVLHLHRNEKYWPDPLKFDPDRFSEGKSSKRHLYTYIPFSAGPRNCVGWKYGMMVTKIMLINIVRKFKIYSSYKSVGEIELLGNVVAKPKFGFKVSLEVRT